MPRIPFAKHSYQLDSLPASAQRLVNLYAEAMPPGGRSEVLVRHVPGLANFGSCGAGPLRAGELLGNFGYVVSGLQVYRVSQSGSTLLIGNVSNGLPVTMAASARQIVIVCPPRAFVLEADAIAEITDPDFPGASSVAYQGGVFVFTKPDSDEYFISDILNAVDYDALDFASAEAVPDKLLRVVESHQELWLFCTSSIEVHHNTGNADFPFEPQSGGVLEVGTIAPSSPAKFDNTLAWLGSDLIVYRANGYQLARISTHAIEREIAQFTNPADAIGIGVNYQGHDQYALTFPAHNRTFVYDAATQLWHERASATGGLGRWRANMSLRLGRHMLIGDQQSGQLFRLDQTVPTEGGTNLTAIATLPPLWADTHRAVMHRLEVEAEVGGNAAEMNLSLDYSDDGGFAYSTPQARSMGAPDDRRRRIFWSRLGNFRQRVLRFTATPGAKLALYGADVEATGLKA